MAHEPYHWVPITASFPTILAVGDILQIVLPPIAGMVLGQLSVGVRGITSGTATMQMKNAAGTVLASLGITAAGTMTTTPSPTPISSSDSLRFGFTGIGIGLIDVTVCQWVRMPSTA